MGLEGDTMSLNPTKAQNALKYRSIVIMEYGHVIEA